MCSTGQWPVELSENILQNLLLHLLPQTLEITETEPILCLSVNRLYEDDHISREDPTEAEHEAAGAVEARACRHPHTIEGTDESIHDAAKLKLLGNMKMIH